MSKESDLTREDTHRHLLSHGFLGAETWSNETGSLLCTPQTATVCPQVSFIPGGPGGEAPSKPTGDSDRIHFSPFLLPRIASQQWQFTSFLRSNLSELCFLASPVLEAQMITLGPRGEFSTILLCSF